MEMNAKENLTHRFIKWLRKIDRNLGKWMSFTPVESGRTNIGMMLWGIVLFLFGIVGDVHSHYLSKNLWEIIFWACFLCAGTHFFVSGAMGNRSRDEVNHPKHKQN